MSNDFAIKKLLSTVILPIGNAIILIDSDWKIKEYLQTSVRYNSEHSHLSVFEKLLEKESHLTKYFKIQDKTEPSLENTFVGPFPIKLYWQNRIFDYYFFSALPSYYCQVYRLVNNNLVAVVYYSPNLPRNDHLEEPVIFYDHWQRLKAFNLPFFNLLKVNFSVPEKLYNISLNTLFSQTPEIISNVLMAGVHKELRNSSWKLCSFAHRRGGWSVSEEAFCRREEKGPYHLFNRSDTFLLLTLNKQLSETTYNLELSFESSSGKPPIIMVGLHGYNAPNSLTPDQAGYSIGYSADNKTIQFKKKGYLICSWLINDEISENEGKHLSVTLGENFFIYKMNGKIIAEHYNFSPLSSFQKYLNLAIATKETVSVSNMVLQKTDDFKASTNLNNYNTLRLLCKPDRHYAAAYVANPYLKKSSRHIRGLMLHEVTDLAHKIENEHLANIKLRNALDSVSASTEFLVSRNERMKKVISEAEIASKSDFAIFIEGATGTGKELLARAIHENSRRNSRPFVKMDCAAIPMQLFETIVFGHIKGAFTGAVSDNSGILALSTGGTVFIDGIENVPLIQQSKLLGALENSFITPLGATQSSKIDVRYIVSSSSSSADLIKNSVLRRDLFHRVSTFYLKIPPLKERKEDLPALCQIFIEQYNVEFSKRIKTLTQNHIDIMENYDWPGNIRELRNLVFRLSAFAENEEIKVNSLKEAMLHHNNLSATSDKAHNYCGRITREQLLAVLNECGNNVSRCARRLKVERSTIYYNLKKFAIHLATIVLSI